MAKLTIYADGCCLGNPGPGGFGVVAYEDGQTMPYFAQASHKFDGTTNNRMELEAAIAAHIVAKAWLGFDPSNTVEIKTDSSYVVHGINSWVEGWIAKGWKTAAKKPVLNQDLWMQLVVCRDSDICTRTTVTWVKGHAGIRGNEEADRLSKEAAEGKSSGPTFFK